MHALVLVMNETNEPSIFIISHFTFSSSEHNSHVLVNTYLVLRSHGVDDDCGHQRYRSDCSRSDYCLAETA